MRNYYPHFHTSENLSLQIGELYKQYPEMLVVGSLGRAAVYRDLVHDPYYEFIQRDQHPLYADKTPRDVDVIGAEEAFASRTLPFWIDATSYDIGGTQISFEDGDWAIAVNGQYEALLHPAVMEPIEAKTIYDISCTTLPAETHLALLRVRGKFRQKDHTTFSLLTAAVEKKSTAQRLPASLYAPFERVHEINAARMERA